jgi:predicted neuraminidase
MMITLPRVAILFACLTASAQTSDPLKPLIDPAVVQHADGVFRPGTTPGTEEALLPILYPSSHAANVIPLRDGGLAAVWFSGTWEGQSGVGIVFSRLDNGSKQWSKTVLIDRHEGESYQNPIIFQAPDGVLDVWHTTQPAGGGENEAKVLHTFSHDSGRTWSQPQQDFTKPGAFTRHPIVVMPSGSWLLPLTYVTSKGIGAGAETNFSATEISADHGRTWTECILKGSEARVQPTVVRASVARVAIPAITEYATLGTDGSVTYREAPTTPNPTASPSPSTATTAPSPAPPAAAKRSPATPASDTDTGYVAFFRDRGARWIYRSESPDGCTWTPPTETVLPNNNASVQATRLRNGHIVIVFDNSQVTKTADGKSTGGLRKPLSIALSTDDGKTWPAVRDIEQGREGYGAAEGKPKEPGREEYSYPTVTQQQDGRILVAYTYRRQTIKAVRFDESWIRQGRSIGLHRHP